MAKILVADDEPELVESLKTILENFDHEVITAADGAAALELLKQEVPDLLLLDVMMPEMDGYTLQKELSRDETLSKIPVVIITALRSSPPLFKQFGQVSQILNKPFEIKELMAAVDKALGRAGEGTGG